MEDNPDFADLQPGSVFHDRLCTKANAEKKMGGNGPDLTLTLNDGSGSRRAKRWQATEAELQAAFTSRFVLVSGRIDTKAQYEGEINLTSITSAEEPENIEAFLSPCPGNHKENVKRFSEVMKSVRETNLNRLLRVVFDPAESTWKQFRAASAAQRRHHAYRGGLIEHSAEVAELCDKACLVLPHLRRDFLVTGALLHDIGKLEEMDHGLGAGEFTESGILVGHVSSGAYMVKDAADRITGFPRNLKYALMNLVLSHHGQAEWGAAKTPSCAEAFVLHACDNISAKAHECRKLAETALPGQFSIKRAPGEYLYVGDLGMEELPPVLSSPAPPRVFLTLPEPKVVQKFATVRLPIKGMVAAGSPEQSSEEDQELREVTIPEIGADYLLRVVGDSMVDAGIDEDDLLFIKHQPTPENGDIVVAYVDHSGDVVKRFRRDPLANDGKGHVWLDSENRGRNYPPIVVDKETQFRGKVVGTLKDG